jgi:acetyltransferase-like isoleucine patch superfamily enzyme
MNNLFFDMKDLKYCGQNVIIGKTVRIRYPELVSIDDNCIIDDFTYISASLELGKYIHIAPNVTIGGGKKGLLKMGNFCGIGAGSSVYVGSTDLLNLSFDSATIPESFRKGSIIENIIFEDHARVGVHSVVLPGVHLPIGFVAAAGTIVRKRKYEQWTLYGGYECKMLMKCRHKEYDRDVEQFLMEMKKT